MKNKITIAVSLIVTLAAVGGIWFYLNQKPPVSHQFNKFMGVVSIFGDGYLGLYGDYIKGDDQFFRGGDKKVAVYVYEQTRIVRTTIKVLSRKQIGENNDLNSKTDTKTENIDLTQFEKDVKNINPVVTVISNENILDKPYFQATEIHYTIIQSVK